MAKKSRRKQQRQARRTPWSWAVLGGALLLIIGGVWLAWPGNTTDPNFESQVTGAPRLVVDQTTIDEGDVKVNTQIRTAYRLQNVGDQPLKILGEPAVELIEGC
jgi:hypothetical protein